ncbi:hypothetical protein QL285_062444 [Trifolium repens]|nr:hypothetical protein QL285_062444 [Trifolium repens]
MHHARCNLDQNHVAKARNRDIAPAKRYHEVNLDTPSIAPPPTHTIASPPTSHPKANISATVLDLFSANLKRRSNLSHKGTPQPMDQSKRKYLNHPPPFS